MNGVRRFFAASNSKPLQPESESSQFPPSPSNGPTLRSPGAIPSLANVNVEPPHHNQTFTSTSSPTIYPEETNNFRDNFRDNYHVNGASESFSNNSHLTSGDSFHEYGLDLGATSNMNNAFKRQIPLNLDQPSFKTSTRDDLLLSLLTSEVIVDSRDYETLTVEEVETLKEEQQHLILRIDAVKKKLNLELKIRDVSQNLRKLDGSAVDTEALKRTNSTNNKLNVINAELTRTLEEFIRVDRRLLQHQSAVLSQSVRNLERQLNPESLDHTFSSSLEETLSSPKLHARTPSSSTSTSNRTKFEGAHLFAGHAQSVVPASFSSLRSNHLASKQRIIELEEKLKTSDDVQKLAEIKFVALEEECKQLRQQNMDLEKAHELQLSHAQDMINVLENKIKESLNALQIKEQWERDKKDWDEDRKQLESRLAQFNLDRESWEMSEHNWHVERQNLENSLRYQRDTVMQLEGRVNDLSVTMMEKERLDQLLSQKDDELRQLNQVIERDRAIWQAERAELEEKLEHARNAAYELGIDEESMRTTIADLREILEELVELHDIPHDSQDKEVLSLLSSVRNHLISLTTSIKDVIEEKSGLEDQIHMHESDLRQSIEAQKRLRQELEDLQSLQLDLMVVTPESNELPRLPEAGEANESQSTGHSNVVDQLMGLWELLPSVESRAGRIPKSGPMSPVSPSRAFSLSDLDVRALKSLYDPKQGFVSPIVNGQFSIEEFVRRVHSLINDDRALIERLLRFAQSHDLLRSNAERAQKLAQESNKGLEMYQLQVRTLEERNMVLSRKQLTMLDEISNLQQSMDILMKEKHDIKLETIEQAAVIQRLTQVISERDRTTPQESPMSAKSGESGSQYSEMQVKLREAHNELEQLRSVESSQRVALLDEVNHLQQENNQLRDQLRNRR